jgi:DNA-directed RNA polymerase subunit RPC12/RpoP
MKKRLNFKCWKCKRNYSLLKEITPEQELIVQCPYCSAEAVASLKPYERKKIPLVRGENQEEASIGYEYDFPDAIPTRKPE